MKRHVICFSLLLAVVGWSGSAFAFCGFYVAKADTKLYNKASQVAIVRHDDKTVITMGNDFRGNVTEFAMVIPVPTVLEREQIHIGDKKLLEHLDAYSAARLVEYFDPNPCHVRALEEDSSFFDKLRRNAPEAAKAGRAKALGVTIEAQYTVGEYDILILSAKQSNGLETWLRESGYRIPKGASSILASYLKQDMKFFVAKVNLKEHAKLGFTSLRPIQVAFETPKFMLPIRLGTVNADGPQELFIYLITRKGRVETTNYRTIKLPAAKEIPVYVKDKFPDFYRDMFSRQVVKENMRGVFLEYAWNMNWCDPCAANPLSAEELRNLGVFWQKGKGRSKGGAQDAFITRLHVRYDAKHFPEDLFFQETSDRSNFQARYILRHPWTGSDDCPAAQEYRKRLRERQEREAQTLAHLTGWNINDIRRTIGLNGNGTSPQPRDKNWWERLWGN